MSPGAVTSPVTSTAFWIGDSYTEGAGATSSATGEAIATSHALGWYTYLDAEGGTGFVANGHANSPSNKPLPARLSQDAARFASPPDVVLIDAGRNDRGYRWSEVRRTVVSYCRAVAGEFPSSAVVLIAPFLMRSKPTAYLALRRLLGQQAKLHHWAFVDPIGEGWVNQTAAKLVASDGIHPNQAGYNYIVAHLAPAIEHALAAAHEHVK